MVFVDGNGLRNVNPLVEKKPELPINASAYNLTIPEGLHLQHLAVGFGTQNYTCSLEYGVPNWIPLGASKMFFFLERKDFSNWLENVFRE